MRDPIELPNDMTENNLASSSEDEDQLVRAMQTRIGIGRSGSMGHTITTDWELKESRSTQQEGNRTVARSGSMGHPTSAGFASTLIVGVPPQPFTAHASSSSLSSNSEDGISPRSSTLAAEVDKMTTDVDSMGVLITSTSPTGSASSDVDVVLDENGQPLPRRPKTKNCMFYLTTGRCGFGMACRYDHPPEKVVERPKQFNSMGLPLRENAELCSHYMRVGWCRFGNTCKFNHPQNVLDTMRGTTQSQVLTPLPPPPPPPANIPQRVVLPVNNHAFHHHTSPRNRMGGNNGGAFNSVNRNNAQMRVNPASGPASPIANGPYGAQQPTAIYYYSVPLYPPQPQTGATTDQLCMAFYTSGSCPMYESCPFLHR